MDQVTSADGTSIAYDRRGTGPALLLVHGTTADHRRWAGISPHLDEHSPQHIAMDTAPDLFLREVLSFLQP